MVVNYFKTSSDGKNLLLSVSGKQITAMACKSHDQADFIDISSVLTDATIVVYNGIYYYVIDILLESVGIESAKMYELHVDDADGDHELRTSYLAPAYFNMYDRLKEFGTAVSMKDYIFLSRLFMIVEGHKLAMVYERYEEAQQLFESIVELCTNNPTRFKDLDLYPTP